MKKLLVVWIVWVLLTFSWIININSWSSTDEKQIWNSKENIDTWDTAGTTWSWIIIFSENFEDKNNIYELFWEWRWTNFHMQSKTNPDKNTIRECIKNTQCVTSEYTTRFEISQEKAQEWKKSLKFVAEKQDGTVKSSLSKQDVEFKKWDTVIFSAYYYLEGSENINDIYLFDLEVDPSNWFLYKWSPGRRIFLDSREWIASDLWKWIKNDTKYQKNHIKFPQDVWVHLQAEIYLSDNTNGNIKIWQDNKLIMNENGITLPKDDLPYSSIEVWLSANVSGTSQVLYMDDIQLSKK